MKTFWFGLVLVLLVGVSYASWSAMAASRQRAIAQEQQAIAASERDRAAKAAAEVAAAAQAPTVPPPTSPAPVASATAPAPSTPAPTAPTPTPVAPAATATPATPSPSPTKIDGAAPPPAAPEATTAKPAAETKSGGTVGATTGAYQIAPSKMEPQPDGSVLVEGAFTVKGDGSDAKPFEIPWELLIAAEKTYNPSEKLTTIPQAIAMLDGKRVRITGYVAFPLYVQQPRELLSMLNQWDGCCIGVPPTPYDAIEVSMKDVVAEDDRMATFGVIEGKFGVKPYVVGDWLVGLYVMEDGKLTAKQFNGAGT
ncbi:MAG: DUF3299 domain-containing protein [Phycisphaerales bacterium]